MLKNPSKTVIILGYVWPESRASAAGIRTWQWIHYFQSRNWRVIFSTGAAPSDQVEALKQAGVETANWLVNQPGFEDWISSTQPEVVLFDRYVVEEQFGWRVKVSCPKALRVIDSQDFHALRKVRQGQAKQSLEQVEFEWNEDLAQIIEALKVSEDLLREFASFLRSDSAILISPFEKQLIEKQLGYGAQNLVCFEYAYPVEAQDLEVHPPFEDRQHFVFIGSGRHAPNVDAIHVLKRIWPQIRAKIPQAQLHIYGENLPKSVTGMNADRDGFCIRGWVEDQYATLKKYRVLLAPLRFGAGLKGKIVDAWSVGLPVVTTPIGIEGYQWDSSEDVAADSNHFIRVAMRLYGDETAWNKAVHQGSQVLSQQCSESIVFPKVDRWLMDLTEKREKARLNNWVGQILWREQFRSTEFFSRWIQLKNRIESGPGGAL